MKTQDAYVGVPATNNLLPYLRGFNGEQKMEQTAPDSALRYLFRLYQIHIALKSGTALPAIADAPGQIRAEIQYAGVASLRRSWRRSEKSSDVMGQASESEPISRSKQAFGM